MTSKCYYCCCKIPSSPSAVCSVCISICVRRSGAMIKCCRCSIVFYRVEDYGLSCNVCIEETKKWSAIFATKLAMVACAISARRLECVRGRTATPKKNTLRNFVRDAAWRIKLWDVGIAIPALLSHVKGATKWVLARHCALGAIRLRQNQR